METRIKEIEREINRINVEIVRLTDIRGLFEQLREIEITSQAAWTEHVKGTKLASKKAASRARRKGSKVISSTHTHTGSSRYSKPRILSPEARERIRQGQIKRWAKVKRGAKSKRNIAAK